MLNMVFLNVTNDMEASIMTFVTFRRTLKSILRNKYESVFHEKPDDSLTAKKLMRILQKHVSFNGEVLKTAGRHMNAVSCGTYMAEITYIIFTMLGALNYEFDMSSQLRKISGIINDSPRMGDAMKKIIFALDTIDELASCHECFEVLDIPTCIDTIDYFLEKTTALVLSA